MTHPLLDRLTDDLGWPHLKDRAALDDFTRKPGTHVVLIPGDPARNLETADVAVILPELRLAFQGRFDCAVAGDALAQPLGEAAGSFKTPNLVFFRDGEVVGAIPRVRDWTDYTQAIVRILGGRVAA